MKRLVRLTLLVLLICSLTVSALASGYVYTTGDVNLRYSPDLDGTKITTVPKGAELYYTNTSYDHRNVKWFYVYYNGHEGWISSNYTNEKDPNYDGFVQSHDVASSDYITTDGKMNIRSQPTINSSSKGTVPKGTTLYYTDTAFDERNIRWVYIHYNGTSGWVSTKYTEELGGWDEGRSGSSGTVRATGDVTVRTGPSKDYSQMGTLHKGETASYAGQRENDSRGVTWYKIYYGGNTGWVSSKYSSLN